MSTATNAAQSALTGKERRRKGHTLLVILSSVWVCCWHSTEFVICIPCKCHGIVIKAKITPIKENSENTKLGMSGYTLEVNQWVSKELRGKLDSHSLKCRRWGMGHLMTSTRSCTIREYMTWSWRGEHDVRNRQSRQQSNFGGYRQWFCLLLPNYCPNTITTSPRNEDS